MLGAQIISDFAALEALTPAWRALYQDSGASFVMSPTWQLAWWRAMGDAPSSPFGDQRKIVGVAVRDEAGQLRGLALFTSRWVTVAAIPRVRLDAFGSGEPRHEEVCSEYLTVLAREADRGEVAEVVVDALLRSVGRWHELLLPAMRADDPMLDPLVRRFAGGACDVTLQPAGGADYARLPASFEAYLASMPKKNRYFVRRTLGDFEAWAGPGGWSFERVRSAAELTAAMADLIALHGARWGPGHVFERERFLRFHEMVTKTLIDDVDGRLDLWRLTVHGKPVAAVYNIVSGRTAHHYQAGRVVDVPAGVKLGIVANVLAIQRAIASGLTEYDFLPGDAVYKRQLGQGRHRLLTLRVIRCGADAVALDLLANAVRAAGSRFVRPRPVASQGGEPGAAAETGDAAGGRK